MERIRRVVVLIVKQDPAYDTIEEHSLKDDDFENYLHQRVRTDLFLIFKFANH